MRSYTAHVLKLFAFIFVFTFAFAGVASAQQLYATIRGQVLDQTKAAVPGAQVTATNTGTNQVRNVTTQSDGSYEFIQLPIGTYSVTVKKEGFQAYVATGITLVVNQIYVLNPSLEVGATSTTVSVEAAKTQVETTSMQLGSTIEAPTIVDMPLNGRNWVQLQQLQTGVVAASDRFGSNYATNGSQSQQNSYLINGTDSNDEPLNTPLIIPSPDAIAEFRMITNTINPEYGRNSGAILDAVIKSGTNQFHGDGFEFYRDTFLNTRTYFQNTAPVFHQNQYGGTFGGPVWKDHTFGFFSFQGTKNATPQTPNAVPVYSAAQLAGTFSGDPTFNTSGSSSPIPLFGDPCPVSGGVPCAAGTAYAKLFASGVVPTADFNTLSSALVSKFVPAPSGGSCPGTDFCFNPSSSNNTKQYLFQINQNLGQHDAVWFLGFLQSNTNPAELPFTGATLPGFAQISSSHDKQFTGAWNHIFSANTLNEFRLGYTRLNFLAVNPASPVAPSSLGPAGNTFNIIPQDLAGQGAPLIGITGFFTLGFSNNGPQPRIDQTKQITDNFSRIYGKHTLKFGEEFRDFWVTNPFFFDNNGNFGFGGAGTFSTGDPGADFLLGYPDGYAQSSGGFIDARAREFYSYAQDEYKLRSDFTLTYGMGYQVDTPLRDIANGGEAINCFNIGEQSTEFPTAPVGINFPGDPNCPVGGYYTHYNDFAPRLGFAWAPNLGRFSGGQGNFSVRGGFGMYYNRSEEELTLQNLLAPPFALADAGIGDLGTGQVPSLSTPFADVRCVSQIGAAIAPGADACPATNGSIANKYPFTPAKPGVPLAVPFSFFEPFSLNLLDPNTRVPTAYNYNLTVQRQLPGQIILSVGYVGAEGRHLEAVHELNPLHNSTACAADKSSSPGFGCGSVRGIQPFEEETIDPTTVSSTNPTGTPCGTGSGDSGRACMVVGNDPFYYPYANGGIYPSLEMQSTMTNSNYNSLQVSANKALSHGLDFLASYTWSHSLDFGSSYENSSAGTELNPFNFRSFYGDSAFDARNRFVFSYDYQLGSLSHVRGFNWVPSRFGAGWHLAGITTLQTGFPITLSDTGFTSLQCNAFAFYGCWDRPNAVSAVQFQDPRSAQNIPSPSSCTATASPKICHNYWFNPLGFAKSALGTVGDANRNFFHGPGINDWDMVLSKDTRITETTSLELRMEFYNVFNHAQFNNPGGNIRSGSTFGIISGATNGANGIGGRLMQLGAKFYF